MNNSIKTPIVVTEAEEREFARRFKANRPKTFSGVIFHAADALEKFIKRDDTVVDMCDWHYIGDYEGRETVCFACLAGAAMIDLCGATGFESREEDEENHAYTVGAFDLEVVDEKMSDYELSVNSLSEGRFKQAWIEINYLLQGSEAFNAVGDAAYALNVIGNRFGEEANKCRRGSSEYIGLLRRAAEEVKALGL